MKVKFKLRKGSGVYISILAGLAFVAMAVTRFNFPVEKVLEFLGILLVLLLVVVILAAPLALAIRWWMNRNE